MSMDLTPMNSLDYSTHHPPNTQKWEVCMRLYCQTNKVKLCSTHIPISLDEWMIVKYLLKISFYSCHGKLPNKA